METELEDLESLHIVDVECITNETWISVERVINSALLPKVDLGFDVPPEKKDFENYILVALRKLKALREFMAVISKSDVYKKKNKKLKPNFVINLLILCGEHNTENKWTTEETINYSRQIVAFLCEILNCEGVWEVLVGEKCFYDSEVHRLYRQILLNLRPKLLKDTWKKYPGAVACYSWLLFQVSHKYLHDYLGMVVPTALILTDDFVIDSAVMGIKCISYIAENSTKTDLHWHAEVMYAAVKQSLFHKNACVVRVAVKCLITLLDMIERSYLKDDYITDWSKYDEVMDLILQNLELWQNSDVREAYMETLPSFIESMPLSIVNWSTRLLELFGNIMEAAEHCEPVFLKYTILSLHSFLRKSWPRVSHHSKQLLRILLRFLMDVTDILCDSPNKSLAGGERALYDEVVREAEQCLLIVVNCSQEKVKDLCPRIKELNLVNRQFQEIMHRTFV